MTIALDGTPLSVATGGIRRYTWELARALAANCPSDTIRLISDQPLPPETPVAALQGGQAGPLGKRWWSFGIQQTLRTIKADVFHGTDFAVPYLRRVPAVLTLHDLSPWRNPEWHQTAGRVRRRTPLLLRLGAATLVITPTEAVRREAISRFGLSEDRVVAVPEAASESFRPTAAPKEDYFLFVGTLEPRKNLALLLDAFAQVRQTARVRLVVVGRRRDDCPPLADVPDVEYKGPLPDSDLPYLYARAIALVYPSFYEGFGLPVLEAMSCGTPVIASNDLALCELAGGAAIHVDAADVRGLAAAMLSVANDPERRARMSMRSLERASQFSWRRTAALTREVYVEAIRRCG